MQVTLWGIRGTSTVCGQGFQLGGNTACIDIELGNGRHIVLDAGSGFTALLRTWEQTPLKFPPTILFSHYHKDHTCGLPLVVPQIGQHSLLALYGPVLANGMQLKDALAVHYDDKFLPVPETYLPKFEMHDFRLGERLNIDGVSVETASTCHQGGCCAYKITAEGWCFAYTGDHEISLSGKDQASSTLADFLEGADVVLADANFSEADHASHTGWGHSHPEQWIHLLQGRDVRHIVFTHFDASYDDTAINVQMEHLDKRFKHIPISIHAAYEGMVLGQNGPQKKCDNDGDFCNFFQRVATYSDTHTSLTGILHKAREITNADAGSIYLVIDNELIFASAQNDTLFPDLKANKFFYLDYRLPMHESSIAGYVATTGESLNIADVYTMDMSKPYSFNKSFDESSGYHTQSLVALPLRNMEKQVKGVLQLINCKHNDAIVPFSKQMEEKLSRLTNTAAVPLERAFMTTNMIMHIIELSAMRNTRETMNHVWRVGCMASELYQRWATNHKLDPEHILVIKGQLRFAAMLHDIGKVALPDAILKKSGALNRRERNEVKKHAAKGASLFRDKRNEIERMAYDIALHHHAMWDGSGYTGDDNIPTLAGEDIPIYARITSLVDAYDMIVYRGSKNYPWNRAKRAMAILVKKSGVLFDPELVNIFVEMRDIIEAIYERYPEPTDVSQV